MTGAEQIIVGVIILVVGGLLLAGSKRMIDYLSDAVAAKLVSSINGQLGLDEIRTDISTLKDDVHSAQIDRRNLQRQLETIITDR